MLNLTTPQKDERAVERGPVPHDGGRGMKEKSNMLVLPCDCKCCMLVIEKTVWEDGDINYNISVQDSRYDHNYNTLWGRIKRAAKVLFG